MPLLQKIKSAAAYLWDQGKWLFVSADDAEPVPPREVRAALDTVLDASQERLRGLAGQLRDGELGTAEWASEVQGELMSLHLAAKLAATGGLEQWEPEFAEQVGETLAEQFGYLDRFAGQIDVGEIDLESDGFAERAASYADAARVTYEDGVRDGELATGTQFAKRELDPDASDHCEGCLEAASLGWVPVDECPEIGSTECGQRCRCLIAYADELPADPASEEEDFSLPGLVVTDAVLFYSEDQARDEHGRWTDGGTGGAPGRGHVERVARMGASARGSAIASAMTEIRDKAPRAVPTKERIAGELAANLSAASPRLAGARWHGIGPEESAARHEALVSHGSEALWALRNQAHSGAHALKETLAVAEHPDFLKAVRGMNSTNQGVLARNLGRIEEHAKHQDALAGAAARALADPRLATHETAKVARAAVERGIWVNSDKVNPEDRGHVKAMLATLPKVETLGGSHLAVHVVPKGMELGQFLQGSLGGAAGYVAGGKKLFEQLRSPAMVELGAARKGGEPALYKRLSRSHYLRHNTEQGTFDLVPAHKVPSLARLQPGSEFSAAAPDANLVIVECEFADA